jgi:phosphoglycerol transferase MdoB-like AlkP superfamily enzyme
VARKLAERWRDGLCGLFPPVLAFALLALLLLGLSRLAKLLLFADAGELQASLGFVDDLFLRGARFDLKLIASALLLPWLMAPLSLLLPGRFFRRLIVFLPGLALALLLWLELTDIGYLAYYGKPIDVLIFGLLQDDTGAILATMAAHRWIAGLLFLFLLLLILSLWLYRRLLRGLSHACRKWRGNSLWWWLGLLLLAVLARGSLDGFPLQRKQASVSNSAFINSLVMNGSFNLYYAWRDHAVNNEAAFRRDTLSHYGLKSLDELLARAGYSDPYPLLRRSNASLPKGQRPPHVVFVQMEGWSAEIARRDAPDNPVLGRFRRHGDEDFFATRFFATTYGTNPTIESLLLNAPITPLSQSVARQTRFSMSNVLPFRRAGYDSLFLSGGYASWRNHNLFWPLQGFDRYLGRSEIEARFDVDASDNPWGVYDEYVFRYLEQELEQADRRGKPLFSFVLTTNNHPPVRLPPDYRRPAFKPSRWGFEDDDEEKLSLLSGYHYQSDQLGAFLDWLKASSLRDRVIVVATGDHPLRSFAERTAVSQRYLHYAVPAYLYVPPALDRLQGVDQDLPGSHNDLFPTLFELALPDAEYFSFGTPFMEKKPVTALGRGPQRQYLLAAGVADAVQQVLYPWEDDGFWLLSAQARPLDPLQRRLLEQARYRRILREYLLVRDYRKQEGLTDRSD